MLDRKFVLNNLDLVKERLALKGFDFDVEVFIDLEKKRKEKQTLLEEFQNKRNTNTKEIKQMFINKEQEDIINEKKQEGQKIGEDINQLKAEFEIIEKEILKVMQQMPNLPHEKCPIGNGEEENVFVRKHLEPTKFDFEPKDHVELTKNINNTLDFEKGVQLAKSRFVVMKDKTAKLHRALAQFMLDLHTEQHGYIEVNVPVIANRETLTGTGQLPKFEEDLFKIDGLDMALIPTAEVPLTNLVKNETLTNKDLPLKLTAHSLCFRSEAGSAGRDVKGILRQHQFEKVELVQIVKAENSNDALEEILGNAEKVLQLLELPYQVVELCTGDLGFGATKTYDIEVWIPSQNTYREISSCSNMGDFQARRLKAKFKDGKHKELLHTLNGSGLAVGRTLLAILENNQKENGNIKIPKVLQPYMNGLKEI